jgi:hypothetical protein
LAIVVECKACGDDPLYDKIGEDNYRPTFCGTCGEKLPTVEQVEAELDAKYITTPNGSMINRDDTSTLCQVCRGLGCVECDNNGVWTPKYPLSKENRFKTPRMGDKKFIVWIIEQRVKHWPELGSVAELNARIKTYAELKAWLKAVGHINSKEGENNLDYLYRKIVRRQPPA